MTAAGDRVTVVIPTHNRGDIITAAIRSALDQGPAISEVIVVDDASTDDTAEVVAAVGDPRVRLIRRERRGGPAAARNDGLEAAAGDVIAFLDSDDRWLPGKIDLQLACFDRVPEIGMICTDLAAVDPHGNPLPGGLTRIYAAWRDTRPDALLGASLPLSSFTERAAGTLWWGDLLPAMIGGNLVHTSTVAIRRDRADAVGGFDTALTISGEDFDFHLRTCAAGPVGFLTVPTTRYRFGAPDQLTGGQYLAALSGNYLRTLHKAAAAYRGDPRVPRSRLRRSIAAAAAWHGEELLNAGRPGEARPVLLRSLTRPRFRSVALLIDSVLPAAVSRRLRTWFGSLRSRAGR